LNPNITHVEVDGRTVQELKWKSVRIMAGASVYSELASRSAKGRMDPAVKSFNKLDAGAGQAQGRLS